MKVVQENDFNQWMVFILLLKEIASSKGITHAAIAEETGMIESGVSRFFSLRFKPTLDTFLKVSKAVKVNFFFEDQESNTDLNQCFERAMDKLGRRPDKLSKN